jgi:hypothetical protein
MRAGLALNCITASNSLYFMRFIPRNTGMKLLATTLNLRNVKMVEVEPFLSRVDALGCCLQIFWENFENRLE